MRAIMMMFDSLNRHFLPNYGCDWTVMPNFRRLTDKAVTFDNFYAGSMPVCPPAGSCTRGATISCIRPGRRCSL